jgi:hypothetical protein
MTLQLIESISQLFSGAVESGAFLAERFAASTLP